PVASRRLRALPERWQRLVAQVLERAVPRDRTVGQLAGQAVGLRPERRDQHRHVGRVGLAAVDPEAMALEVERPDLERSLQDRDELPLVLEGALERDAEAAFRAGPMARADAKPQSP